MDHKSTKILNATKWSVIAEISAKIVAPFTNIILARLLTPDAFGVVATATMIFSFADMFTDSGFQKYLVQHNFVDAKDKIQSTNVAFWTNLFLSFLFWVIIIIFNSQLAIAVGNPGLGIVFIVSCASLPLTSFSSIQMALYKRDFDFKTLFYVRLVSVAIPLFVTVPLAFFTKSFWSIIIGTICGNLSNAIILTWKSSWKPSFFYSFAILHKMLSFSMWSLIEAFAIWLGGYIDVFFVGLFLSSHYLGLYKTSINTVNQIMGLVTASTTSVLFSALSRSQNNKKEFERIFFAFQKNVGLFILPMGVGIYLYRDFVTLILLGKQWSQASDFIGLWALVNAIKIVLSNYCSEAYRAMGKPKISVFVQVSQLFVLVPLLFYGAQNGFTTLYIMRCLVSLELVVVNLFTVRIALQISSWKMIKNITPEIIASAGMIPVALICQNISNSFVWELFSIFICIIIYFAIIFLLPWSHSWFTNLILSFIKHIKKKGA